MKQNYNKKKLCIKNVGTKYPMFLLICWNPLDSSFIGVRYGYRIDKLLSNCLNNLLVSSSMNYLKPYIIT